ncbi:MAG TPA: hypothetical protein VF623_10100 [Segetibacter sp.]|jgi:hypothetical protein
MKKRLFLLLAIFINISYFCYSQDGEGNLKKAQSLQIAYLTKELSLTPDEAQKLFPIFNNYIQEIRGARREKGNDQIAQDEKILNTRKKYREDFKKVLGSEERVNKLFVAEKNFRDMLRKELIERRIDRQ